MAAAASARDIRLDLFRGLALWFIFLDHIPTNIVSWLTVRNYGFSDATEIFVFISGYTAVIAYSRMMARDGWTRAAARIYRRVWQLYVAHILLFVAFSAQIAFVSIARDTPALIEEMQLLGLGENPYRAILEAALLKFRPVNLDVLPLYIVLLAAFPLVLPAVVRWPLARDRRFARPLCRDLPLQLEPAGLSRRKGLVLQSHGLAGRLPCRCGLRRAGPPARLAGPLPPAPDGACRRLSGLLGLHRLLLALQSAGAADPGLGRPGRSIRSTRPTSISCDSCISWPSPGWSGCWCRSTHPS